MLLLAAIAAVLYGVGVRRMAQRGRRWPVPRTFPFFAGIAALGVAAMVPRRSFTTHMFEHILLGMAAPLLLALGAPVTLALQAAGGSTKAALRRALHHRIVKAVTHPLVGWTLFGGSMIAYYFSPLLDWSARNQGIDALVHLHFLGVGALFVWPLVALDPVPTTLPFGGRLLAVLAAVPFHAFLGVAMMSASTPFAADAYPALSDQRTAAGLLWGFGELFTFAVAASVFFRWVAAEQRSGTRFDRVQQQAGEVIAGGARDD